MEMQSFYEILTNTEITLSTLENRFKATAELPDTAPLNRISCVAYNPQHAGKDLLDGVYYIARYNGVNHDDVGTRGERAADIISTAPGVVETEYTAQRLTVTQTVFTTTTYSDVKFFCGLEETAWWFDYSREHGYTLTFEYRVASFAPPFPAEQEWSDLRDSIATQGYEPMVGSSFDYYTQLADEYTGEREIVRHHDIMDGAPRLAGTGVNALHVYYLVVLRNGAVDDVIEVTYPDLSPEDITYIIEYVEQNCVSEAETYAKETAARLSTKDSDEINLDELPDWSHVPSTLSPDSATETKQP